MKKYLNIQYLPHLSLGAGLIGLLLQGLLFLLTLDQKGLVASGHFLNILAWIVLIAVNVLFAVAVSRLHGHNRYGDNYPASTLGAIGSFALAAGILVTVPFHLDLQGNLLAVLWLVLAVLTVPSLIFTGLCRRSGKRPAFLFHSVTCLFFAIHLVHCCQSWSSEPQIETYGFSLLASIALMLSAYHRAAFDSGIGRRRMQLFTGLAAGCLCLAAIPGSQHKLMYLTGSLWALTNLCVLTPPRRRRRPAEENGPAEAAETPDETL